MASPEANLDGPEFYFAVLSGKKLSRKQMTKIYKDFYKDDCEKVMTKLLKMVRYCNV